MLDYWAFARSLAFATLYGAIEYRYINRAEAEWTKGIQDFYEKPAFWKVSPYQVYLLLPAFIAVGFTLPVSAWAGNAFFIAFFEDVAYFAWRKKMVVEGEWTTTLFGSFKVGKTVIPTWWVLCPIVVIFFYALPF